MSAIPEKNIPQYLRTNSVDYFPVSVDDCIFDIKIHHKTQNEIKLSVFAVPISIIESCKDFIGKLGLKFSGISVSGTPVIVRDTQKNSYVSVALLNNTMSVMYVQKGILTYSRQDVLENTDLAYTGAFLRLDDFLLNRYGIGISDSDIYLFGSPQQREYISGILNGAFTVNVPLRDGTETMTYKPDEGMTAAQIKKEVQRQAVIFEEKCKQGQVTAAVKFEDFARQWFTEYAEIKLKTQTLRNYHFAEKRIYKAIGHLRLDKITPRHIQKFILELNQELAPKTIKNYICLISSIFNYAVKMQQATYNPCANVTIPRQEQNDKEICTLEETQLLLDLLSKADGEDLKFAVFFVLAIYTGLRRGELLGLEWRDICEDTRIITICRTSNWTKERGVYTDTPKTKSSHRSIKLPEEVMDFLRRFREYQDRQKAELGDKWEETDRLFTRWNGLPMSMNSPHVWFEKFCKDNGLRYVNIHSWRHFNASMLIFKGIDVKSVQSHLGHSTATTTVNTPKGYTNS